MDNVSFYHSKKIAQMCADAGVKLVFLPLYSPDLNPIEEFFAEPKGFMKRNWGMILVKDLIPSSNGVSKLLVRNKRAQEVIFNIQAYR